MRRYCNRPRKTTSLRRACHATWSATARKSGTKRSGYRQCPMEWDRAPRRPTGERWSGSGDAGPGEPESMHDVRPRGSVRGGGRKRKGCIRTGTRKPRRPPMEVAEDYYSVWSTGIGSWRCRAVLSVWRSDPAAEVERGVSTRPAPDVFESGPGTVPSGGTDPDWKCLISNPTRTTIVSPSDSPRCWKTQTLHILSPWYSAPNACSSATSRWDTLRPGWARPGKSGGPYNASLWPPEEVAAATERDKPTMSSGSGPGRGTDRRATG